METKADGPVVEQGCEEKEVQGCHEVDQAEPVKLRTVEGPTEATAEVPDNGDIPEEVLGKEVECVIITLRGGARGQDQASLLHS